MTPTSSSRPATWLNAGIGLLGGAVASISLPPFGFWPMAPLGVAILLLALEDHTLGRRALCGFAFGLGLFVPGLWWAQHFNWYGAAILTAMEAAFFALGAALVMPGRGRTLSALGALVLLEALRETWPLGGLPLGGLPLGQADGPLVDVARLAGPFGLMLVVVLSGAGIRALVATLAARDEGGAEMGLRSTLSAVLLGSVVMIALLAAAAPSGGPSRGARSVAAVQGGGQRGTSVEQVPSSTVTRAALKALKGVPVGTQLTVLPEDVVALPGPLAGSAQDAVLSQAARALRTTLVVGITSNVATQQFRNYVAVYGPSGALLGEVEKVHRVPFGEYVPARGFFSHLADVSGVPRDAIAGSHTELLETPAGRLGFLISYEVFFADLSAGELAQGAQLLVVATNTTSYPSSQMPSQELAAAEIQAVERGRDLVQASPTGFSALINRSGDVLERSSLSAPSVLTGQLQLYDGQTLYSRLGDWPLLVLAALCLAAGQLRGRLGQGRRAQS
jgi:apolipoprotein N-acyltransferase